MRSHPGSHVGASVPVLALALALFPWAALAQTTHNPSTVSFRPSPDHDAVDPEGRAVLSRYELKIYELGAANPLLTLDLGKPASTGDGDIKVEFVSLLAWRPQGVLLEARVVAVGPGGSNASEPSNAFMFDGCTVSVSPAGFEITSDGGTRTVSVSAAAGCAWQSASAVDWITLTRGWSGSGNGAVTFTVTANLSGLNRTGTLWIGDGVVTVLQAAPAIVSPGGIRTPPRDAVFIGFALRRPADGAVFTSPARIIITAALAGAAPAAAGSRRTPESLPRETVFAVTQVSFYANGTLVGTASAIPYSVVWSNVAAGRYTITAVAADNHGLHRTSPPVTVFVRERTVR